MRSTKREQDGWSRMTLLFKLELIFLYMFSAPCYVYGGPDFICLVPLPFPTLGPRLVRTVYTENLLGLLLSSVERISLYLSLVSVVKKVLTKHATITSTEGKSELGKIKKLTIKNAYHNK